MSWTSTASVHIATRTLSPDDMSFEDIDKPLAPWQSQERENKLVWYREVEKIAKEQSRDYLSWRIDKSLKERYEPAPPTMKPPLLQRLQHMDFRKQEDVDDFFDEVGRQPKMFPIAQHPNRSYFVHIGDWDQLETHDKAPPIAFGVSQYIFEIEYTADRPQGETYRRLHNLPEHVVQIGKLYYSERSLDGRLPPEPIDTGYSVLLEIDNPAKRLLIVFDYNPYDTIIPERIPRDLDCAKLPAGLPRFDFAIILREASEWSSDLPVSLLELNIKNTAGIHKPRLMTALKEHAWGSVREAYERGQSRVAGASSMTLVFRGGPG